MAGKLKTAILFFSIFSEESSLMYI